MLQWNKKNEKAAIAAFYQHLNKNSIIKYINIYDTNIYTTLSETASGKIKCLSDLGYGETKGSDGLNFEKIKIINLWMDQHLKDY